MIASNTRRVSRVDKKVFQKYFQKSKHANFIRINYHNYGVILSFIKIPKIYDKIIKINDKNFRRNRLKKYCKNVSKIYCYFFIPKKMTQKFPKNTKKLLKFCPDQKYWPLLYIILIAITCKYTPMVVLYTLGIIWGLIYSRKMSYSKKGVRK